MKTKHPSILLMAVVFLTGILIPEMSVAAIRADAVVLVNSTSSNFADFEHYIQPYMDHFGIPYTVLNIASDDVPADISNYAVIIVGHRQLDTGSSPYLDLTEQGYIAAAVQAGTGLVNFDNVLSRTGLVPRYQYIQDIFGFSYVTPPIGSGVTFTSLSGGGGYQINCYEDAHQDPGLATTSSVAALEANDNQWTEFLYPSRGYPGVFARYDETPPLMRFHGSVPDGEYTVVAHLYWSHNLRYYWGDTDLNPQEYSIDVTSGVSGDFADYTLGTVTITGGQFQIFVQNADPLAGGNDYPIWGWAWIRLVPADAPPPVMHYITARHQAGEAISTGSMTMAGITTLPTDVTALAMTGSQPFIAVTEYGLGRAVQWGSYNWISRSVKGPMYGLDDLVWRSIVWAARKPFVMKGLPPFVTMRVDDESGPFLWIHIANEFGLKPWAGLFYHNVDTAEAADLKALVDAGDATASVHAKSGTFFYYNHGVGDFSNEIIAANFAEATAWHQSRKIPISKFVLPHYYEFGANVFQGLSDWGVEFVGTMMNPGNGYGAPWVMNGPYRLYETGASTAGGGVYYADFMNIPGYDEKFFNCVTEVRDDAGYEWYPDLTNVPLSVGRGTRQTKRALDGMVLATLFTHGYYTVVNEGNAANWRAILQGITDNLAPYNPMYVTMDHACQYIRAMHTSNIASAEYDPLSRQVSVNFSGKTDMPTMFHLFTEQGEDIHQQLIDVPEFNVPTNVAYTLAGPLDHIVVNPASTTIATGGSQQFTAQGYDVADNPIPNLPFTWSVVSGGGTISATGLFTAGGVPGLFGGTVEVSFGGINGYASVEVVAPALDHFTFETISSPQYVNAPFTVTIAARDISGYVLTGYVGQTTLTDSTGTVVPILTENFVAGLWTGDVTIGSEAHNVTITATDGSHSGTSNPFEVQAEPMFYEVTSASYEHLDSEPFMVTVTAYGGTTINLWENEHQDPVLTTFTNAALLNGNDGKWDEFHHTSGRPFPAVFAGHNEWENNNLQPIHFFATGIPDGRYEVWANLYTTSSQTRYYYGFTEAEALANARYVDNVVGAGGSIQFAEYSLGMIDVTNGRFDLWAGDGDSSTAYFYGWAWIRLVPVPSGITINCAEDSHQDPVLTETPNAALLYPNDNQWTEFFSTGRGFPGVFAGQGETPPVMRFYSTGIPNGEYEVIANVYANASMRYFYGFSSTDPKASYVDVPGCASGTQFREHSLGKVSIADGTFNIYVQDGEFLPGTPCANTYPFFGWARIRLVPTGLVMTSSSPTMQFDADADGIFGEPGDNIKQLVGGTFTIMARDTTPGSGIEITATDVLGRFGYNIYATLNTAPVAQAQNVSTNEDTSVAITLTASDVDEDPLTFAVVEGPSHGTLTGSAPNLIYTPALNYNGPDSFTYKANDGIADSNVATVSLTVNPVNDAPVANAQSVPTDEDIAVAITLTASDVDSGFLTYAIVTPPGHGTLSGSAPSVIYTPASNYHGSDSFTFKVYDGFLDSNVAAVSITVSSVNDPPVASADGYSTNEDTQLVVSAPGVLGNDSDVDANPLTAILVVGPSHGSLALNADGSFTYTPLSNFNGSDSFTYKANDGTADSNVVTVTITVNAVNDAPTVSVSTTTQTVQYSDGIAPITVTATDVDSVKLTPTPSGLPADVNLADENCTSYGTEGISCTWKIQGIVAEIAGSYNVTISVSDGAATTNSEQITITVEPEDADVVFDPENPMAERVDPTDGRSGRFQLTVYITEHDPDPPTDLDQLGDINLANVSMTLKPVGPGSSVNPITCSRTVSGTEYDAALAVTCTFNDVSVNTYTVQVTVNGGYYAGAGEDVLVVYDPSLGFATGGGWFYWPIDPEEEPPYEGYPGDRTNFGFTMKYNKKGQNVQGSLLLIRHLLDGTIYRVKSNALYGLALGDSSGHGWASFSGKSTYLDPDWLEPIGNHEFVVYVEDNNEPGNGVDKFWIQVKDQDRKLVSDMSMPPEATTNAIQIQGGNIVVPHRR